MIGWSRRPSVTVLCGWLTIIGFACGVQVVAAQESLTESPSKIRFCDWNVDQHRRYALGARRIVRRRVGESDFKAYI